jgi:hypothetical protein
MGPAVLSKFFSQQDDGLGAPASGSGGAVTSSYGPERVHRTLHRFDSLERNRARLTRGQGEDISIQSGSPPPAPSRSPSSATAPFCFNIGDPEDCAEDPDEYIRCDHCLGLRLTGLWQSDGTIACDPCLGAGLVPGLWPGRPP